MKKKYIIGGLILLVAVVALGYLGLNSMMTYYYEVGEFLDKGATLSGQTVRVGGEVMPGIQEETKNLTWRFNITDMTGRDATLAVVYKGAVPDTFKVGGQVVVEGKYTSGGVFEANNIVTKCASKYQAAEASSGK